MDEPTPELPALQAEMKRVLAQRNWSLRLAGEYTKIEYSTVRNMWKGKKVGPEFLIRWATAIKEEPAVWLGLGDHADTALMMGAQVSSDDRLQAPELIREPNVDEVCIPGWGDVDEAGRRRVFEIVTSEAERSRLARERGSKRSRK